MFFFVYFFPKDQLPVSYFIIFFIIFIFIYLAEIPLQGPRYQLRENNFLFLFQHIPSYFFIVFNFLLLNSYRSCFWSNFFPKVQIPVSYFIKLKVCTDLWYSSHCRQQGQSESTGLVRDMKYHRELPDLCITFRTTFYCSFCFIQRRKKKFFFLNNVSRRWLGQ